MWTRFSLGRRRFGETRRYECETKPASRGKGSARSTMTTASLTGRSSIHDRSLAKMTDIIIRWIEKDDERFVNINGFPDSYNLRSPMNRPFYKCPIMHSHGFSGIGRYAAACLTDETTPRAQRWRQAFRATDLIYRFHRHYCRGQRDNTNGQSNKT